MSISTTTKTVGATASRIIRVTDTGAAGKDGRVTYEVYNASDATVYMGGSDVTTDNGMPLPSGGSRTLALALYGEAYAIAADEGKTLRIMKVA